jgi:hypothetical protein
MFFLFPTQFRSKLFAPSDRWGPADGSNPATYRKNITVWADVLDWECWKRHNPADWDDDFPSDGGSAQPPITEQPGSRHGTTASMAKRMSASVDPDLPLTESQDATTSQATTKSQYSTKE